MPYRRMEQGQAQRLHRGDLVHLYGNRDDIFQVDLTPRRDASIGTVRLRSYQSGVVKVECGMIAMDSELEECLLGRTPADFNRFAGYFATGGLTQPEQAAIRDYLGRLCLRTGYLWEPGGCRGIPDCTEEANDELGLSSAKGILTNLTPKMYSHSHFFWASKKGNESFIIDPTGVPGDSENRDKYISPFFGLLENSTGFHRTVYGNMEGMDNWGTNEFRPGFHP